MIEATQLKEPGLYLAYFDESGDDGYPNYSSEMFVLSTVYMHHNAWRSNYEIIRQGRRELRTNHGLPIRMEMHARHLLSDKKPYRQFGWSSTQRLKLLYDFFEIISQLDAKLINVVINKRVVKATKYPVLEKALTYSVQRIENDLNKQGTEADRFMIITDEGRVGAMMRTTRKVQRINIIPSKYNPEQVFQRRIERLIEDPLPKKSHECYFVQVVDAVSYVVLLYSLYLYNGSPWARRVRQVVTFDDVISLLDIIKDRLNTKASSNNEYGIVCYPKQPHVA